MFRRVTPAPGCSPDDQERTSVNNTSLSNTPVPASDDHASHRRCSELPSRRDTRVSMDLTSTGTLSFHNISYVIGGGHRNGLEKTCYPSFIKPKPGKQIIDDVSGIFRSGMNAIMGKFMRIVFMDTSSL